MNGKLVKHSRRPEWGTGVVMGKRVKEKIDPATGMSGMFVTQYKAWFSVGGEGWFDASLVLLLSTDEEMQTSS